MKYYKGDKVFLIETREVAIVTRADDQDLLYVEVDGMEIPVFSSDISPEIPKELLSEIEMEIESLIDDTSDEEFEELGLFICLEPQMLINEIKEFNIYLVNSFNLALQFDFQFFLGDSEVFSLEKDIDPQSSMLLFAIEFDQLNENPSFHLDVLRRDIDKEELNFTLRIKPNNLFNKERELVFFDKPVYAYQLLETWEEKVESETETDHRAERLKEIQERVINRLKSEEPSKKKIKWEPASHEIDLHIEKLIQDYKGMSNGEIMQVQIKHFRQAFERAITGGLDRFYAIHGLGKGKLKEEIFRILREYPQVKSFRNEYHPRYGFGATEIFLK